MDKKRIEIHAFHRSGDATRYTTARPRRVAMRHDAPIPGPVRVMESIGGVVTISEATALRLTEDSCADRLTVLSPEGHAYQASLGQCWFPINGPVNEPPRWAPEVAELGPVKP